MESGPMGLGSLKLQYMGLGPIDSGELAKSDCNVTSGIYKLSFAWNPHSFKSVYLEIRLLAVGDQILWFWRSFGKCNQPKIKNMMVLLGDRLLAVGAQILYFWRSFERFNQLKIETWFICKRFLGSRVLVQVFVVLAYKVEKICVVSFPWRCFFTINLLKKLIFPSFKWDFF